MLWLASALTTGPGSSVTPLDSAATSVLGYLFSFGPIGIGLVALAWLLFKGWRLIPRGWEEKIRASAREEGRADLLSELDRTITRAGRAEEQRDEALKIAREQLVPALTEFTNITGALIPLLQAAIRAQEGDAAVADDISGETLALAAGALARAAAAPTPEAIAELARDALSEERDDMTPAEIRALAATALLQAQQISRLMTRLADLLDTPAGDGARG